jgi:hypothetical protein
MSSIELGAWGGLVPACSARSASFRRIASAHARYRDSGIKFCSAAVSSADAAHIHAMRKSRRTDS